MLIAHALPRPNTAIFVHSTRSTTFATVSIWTKHNVKPMTLAEIQEIVAHYLETDEMHTTDRYIGVASHLHETKEQALRDMAVMLIQSNN